MKKVLVMLGVMLFSASAFALNVEAPADKDCAKQKAEFEASAAGQRVDFVVQHILINMADPLENMTDEQAQPLAVCYATFRVKGEALSSFVRDNAGIFPGDVSGKEKANLLAFATRVEQLSEKAAFDQVVAKNNDLAIMSYVFTNMLNPMDQMSASQAAAKAAIYKTYKVKGRPLSEFIREQSLHFDMYAETRLDNFADKIDPNL